MKYRLAGGNVAAADYEVASSVLQENGLTVSEAIRNLFAYLARTREVPPSVREGASGALADRLAAFDELNELVDATPRIPWTEGEARDDVRAYANSSVKRLSAAELLEWMP